MALSGLFHSGSVGPPACSKATDQVGHGGRPNRQVPFLTLIVRSGTGIAQALTVASCAESYLTAPTEMRH
jgi:hypothetical protein